MSRVCKNIYKYFSSIRIIKSSLSSVSDINIISFQVTSQKIHGPCDIIDEALKRYPKRIFPPAAANIYSHMDPLHRKQRRRDARREMKTDPM